MELAYRQESTPFTREGSAEQSQGGSSTALGSSNQNSVQNAVRARSSAVEHGVHIAGVTGSIPVAPTIRPHTSMCALAAPAAGAS